MNAKLFEIVFERLAESQLSGEESNLVLAACQGDEALQSWLSEGLAPNLEGRVARVETGPGAYLQAIQVQGFRGIGENLELKLQPGPGLTLVVGRNGSGKSSLAEALELLLTGRSARWEDRSSIWKSAWRNLHHPVQPKIVADFAQEDGKLQLSREWPQGAEMDASQFKAQPANQAQQEGWKAALEDYRPFLSHNELTLLLKEPSKLYDALYRILGLGDLTEAQERLARLRRQDEASGKAFRAEVSALKTRLLESSDERAQTAAKELGKRSIDWPKVLQHTHSASNHPEEIDALRRLAQADLPDLALYLEKLTTLNERLGLLQTGDAGRSQQLAQLLETALSYTVATRNPECPVCGSGQLDDEWARKTQVQLKELEQHTHEVNQLTQAIRPIDAQIWALCSGPCPTPELEVEWQQWLNTRNRSGGVLFFHLEGDWFRSLRGRLPELREEAREKLRKLEAEWLPLSQGLSALALQAEQNKPVEERSKLVKASEDWLKGVADEIRLSRFQPIAEGMRQFWSTMRQDSNVELVNVLLAGQKTNRRVEVQVKVDDTDNVALGVMSQGELNALALSLFLPRATQPESPFRFICIDDPVQAMDPSKVDGLARVLEQVSKTHQVLVFTHDSRLYEAILRLGIRAQVLEVTRRARSTVELREAHDPIEQALSDARALALTRELPEKVGRKVVPNFCRRALEICLTEIYQRKHPFKLEEYDQAETLNKKASLALFGTIERVGDVHGHLRRYGQSAEAYYDCNKGSHGGYDGDLQILIQRTRDLVGQLRRGG